MEGQQQMDDIQIEYSPTKEEIIEYAKYLGMDIEKDQRYLYIAEEGLRAPLPEGWKEFITQEGEIYYFNQEKQISQWEHPSDEFYKRKFMNQKNKDQQAQQLLQDFVENDIQNQNTHFGSEQTQKQAQLNIVRNSPISEQNALQKNINQLKIQSPINPNQNQQLGRQTPKQEYYEYTNQVEQKLNDYQQKKTNELNEQIIALQNQFAEKKNLFKQQIDSQLQAFINAWEETNAKSVVEGQAQKEEEINVETEKEKILQQLLINFNEQKIIQENKLNQQFNELKEQIQQRIERKYQIQIDMLEAEKKEFDDINQNKSFLNISQRNINNTLVQEQQKMKAYYQDQILRFKNQGQENLKYAIQDYKGNLNMQLQQKRQQKLREMKEKIDQANEQKKDKIRKEIAAEFESKKFELKKQYVIEEKALEQQEKIKIEAEYSSEVSKLELKYIEDLQKLKQSEEMYYLKKQDRLLKIQNEIQQKYEVQEKELITKLERKIQKLEDEQLDLQSKLNTKKIYSKKYIELKNLEQQLNENIQQQNNQIKLTSEQIDVDKENLSGLQNQIQEKLQEYQKLLQEQNQLSIPTSQNVQAQERREQQLIEKVSKLKDDLIQIQSDHKNVHQTNYTNYSEGDILKSKDINLIKKGLLVSRNNENEQNSAMSKEKEQLQQLKKVIEQKLDEIHRPQVDNYASIPPKQTFQNNEEEPFHRKRHSQFESSQFQQQKRYSSYDRAYQSQSQQGFYQDSRRQEFQTQQDRVSKEDQISQLKQQLEMIKNQVIANEQKRKNNQKQIPPLVPLHLKNRELSLDDFANKRIVTPSNQGTIQLNRFGESSRINSHNQSVQSYKAANQTFFYQLRKDWKTIMSLEFEKLKLESDGVRKDKEILNHQIQNTKEEIKSLKKGQNEFLLHDLSRNIQNTVKNAEKVLKQKLVGQENQKINLQKKELELNQKKRILDNIQIKLETMSNPDEEDEIESMYEEYKYISREESQKHSTSFNHFNYEILQQQPYPPQRKQYQEQYNINRSKNKYSSLQQKFPYNNGLSFQEYELDEQEEEGITQQSDQDQMEHNSSWEENNDDDFKQVNQSFQQRIISTKYQSLQPPNKYNKISQEVYIQGKMKHYQDLLSKYTIN